MGSWGSPHDCSCMPSEGIRKMMDFVLKIMDFVLTMMDFVLKMMNFVLEMMDFVLTMMICSCNRKGWCVFT